MGLFGIIYLNENENNVDNQELLASKLTSKNSLSNGTKSGSLGAIIQNFKSTATRRVNRLNRSSGTLWQRDYYEEIIRNEKAYENIRRYILENPLNWNEDEENFINKSPIL